MFTSLLFLACLSLLPAPALTDLTCTRFSPRGSVSNAGVIKVEGEGVREKDANTFILIEANNLRSMPALFKT